jgi:hypothetical protein
MMQYRPGTESTGQLSRDDRHVTAERLIRLGSNALAAISNEAARDAT